MTGRHGDDTMAFVRVRTADNVKLPRLPPAHVNERPVLDPT